MASRRSCNRRQPEEEPCRAVRVGAIRSSSGLRAPQCHGLAMVQLCAARRPETRAIAHQRPARPKANPSRLSAFRGPFFALRRKAIEGIDATRYISFCQQRTRGIGHTRLPTASMQPGRGTTMKTNALTRIYALAMSALFASVATVGVAVLMASSGEQARMEFNASAAARQSSQPATQELTQLQAPAANAKQVL